MRFIPLHIALLALLLTSCIDEGAIFSYNQGNLHYDTLDYPGAITLYADAISQEEDFIQAYNNRGGAHLMFGDCEAATADFETALALNISFSKGQYNHGLCALLSGDYTQAIEDFNNTLALGDTLTGLYYARARSYHLQDLRDEAVLDYEREMALDSVRLKTLEASYVKTVSSRPDSVPYGLVRDLKRTKTLLLGSLHGRSLCRIADGWLVGAQQDLTLLLATDSVFPEANFALAYLRQREGNFQEAERLFAKAVAENPQDPKSLYYLGKSFYEKSQYDSAVVYLSQSAEFNANEPTTFVYLARTYQQLKKDSAAISNYGLAIDLNDSLASAWFNRGNLRYSRGAYEEALEDFNKVIELQPNYANAYYMRAFVRYKTDDKEGTCEDLENAQRLGHLNAWEKISTLCAPTDTIFDTTWQSSAWIPILEHTDLPTS